MNVRNVVTFHAPERPTCWRQDELQQLVALHSACEQKRSGLRLERRPRPSLAIRSST